MSCILKLVIQRPRPGYNVNDQKFEAPIADQFSFPSGHSSRAAMLATLCAAFFPKYRYAAMVVATVVAMSRVAMGRHYLSDAIGAMEA
ncbi:PAP2 family protein [Teladorsagia circumcincta]|uniref:PAP2 family protein n=1 Tax=Teladorsagia circumcincta TaxID=45464 RepID=A0A2G9UBW3_TELCI|nr:PAP2 family protein [Teladorsagia circumcincta]